MFQVGLRRLRYLTLILGCSVWMIGTAQATQVGAPGTEPGAQPRSALPADAKRNLERILRYNTPRGLTAMVRRARSVMFAKRSAGPQLGPAITLPDAVEGKREIPVITLTFADTGANPYPVANLQKELFDGPWPTGTMKQYYEEISYGKFSVEGTAFEWTKLPKPELFYTGPAGCKGILCEANFPNVAQMIREALAGVDASVDYAKYDNDGPDGVPNSGDDDGFVDFVALVHPSAGGECTTSNGIWSHRYALSSLTPGQDFETADVGRSGLKIRVDDYVIMPAVACDRRTMIQIGVFAHEFGHAFGLPDLYDTDDAEASEGIGAWGLMGAGSWGGDGNDHPESPSHMSAWCKEFLGWLHSTNVDGDLIDVKLPSSGKFPSALKIDIDNDRAYVIEYCRKEGFDRSLKASGLLVWAVKNSVINAGLANNRVNADENNKGIGLVEADGLGHLDRTINRADEGDVFPGSTGKSKFDNTTAPASMGNIALCNIREQDGFITLDVFVTRSKCP